MPSKIRIFTSEYCPPCQELKKKLKDASNIEFVDIHTDKGYEEAMEKKIAGVPYAEMDGKTCKILDDGNNITFECPDKKDGL